MTIHITETENVRTIEDDLNPRVYHKEFRCAVCREWVAEDDTVWGNACKAYHVECMPSQHPDEQLLWNTDKEELIALLEGLGNNLEILEKHGDLHVDDLISVQLMRSVMGKAIKLAKVV
jgi:hypothetical protein